MKRLHVIALATVAAALAAGCGSEPKPPVRTASTATQASDGVAPAATPPRQDTTTPTSGSIHIDDKILKACGDIPSAHFAFDSSSIGHDAQASLDALARCFSTGKLAGRNMLLTGHTDPRGETEYNFALGQRRAGSVLTYLAGHGMKSSQLSATSHGELDATGTDEAGWARDRKVDVTLVE